MNNRLEAHTTPKLNALQIIKTTSETRLTKPLSILETITSVVDRSKKDATDLSSFYNSSEKKI